MDKDEWKQAIDDALVCCHLGTADDFESPKHALAALERWHYDLGVSGVCEPKKGMNKEQQKALDRLKKQGSRGLSGKDMDKFLPFKHMGKEDRTKTMQALCEQGMALRHTGFMGDTPEVTWYYVTT